MKKIIFDPVKHSYTDEDGTPYTSVTKLIGKYKQPFDAESAARKASKNKKSKWYGISAEEIMEIWKRESDRSTTLGTWYHNQREDALNNCQTINYNDYELPIYPSPVLEDGLKISMSQQLTDGIYPEYFVYLASAGIAGQTDRISIANGKVDILDYKTNKEIKTEGYKNYEGITQKMLFPLNHLDDCNLNHYALQLSIYMYIVLKHNPNLQPGEIILQHIIFEEEFDKDPYGYPIYRKDEEGNPIVKNIINYKLTYLKDEVMNLLQHHKLNKI